MVKIMKIGQRILNEFKSGKTATMLLTAKYPASKNTVYKYWKVYKLYQELSQKLWEIIFEGA